MSKIYFQKLHPELCDVIKNPAPSINSTPEWWKNADKHILDENNIFPNRENSTIRSCPALSDAFNFGYTIFTPIDIYIDSTNSSDIFWNVPLDMQYLQKYDNFPDNFISFISGKIIDQYRRPEEYHKVVGKMNTFWGIKTDPGYSVWITNPVGRLDLPLTVFDAVIDTDKISAVSPYSFLIRKNFKGIIKAGTPFLQVIPFKRENFVSEIVDKNDYEEKINFLKLNTSFLNSYKKYFWTRKRFE